jgi:hypothetical protein
VDFFIYLFEERRLQPITIRGYSAAISRLFEMCDLPSPTKHRNVSAVLANFENKYPKCKTLVPKWSLNLVLDYLSSEVFNPMEDLSLAELTL